ncbi:hypothetical protein I552_1810 [Mycobacterium xenopi 3993]|nr:hypothetical protein I552_1810 [Mycobacterium xenopi 3993]
MAASCTLSMMSAFLASRSFALSGKPMRCPFRCRPYRSGIVVDRSGQRQIAGRGASLGRTHHVV